MSGSSHYFSHTYFFLLIRYIEEATNCSFWAKRADKSKVICDEPGQYDTLLHLSNVMENRDETKIYEATGCLFTCERFAYELRPVRPLQPDYSIFRHFYAEFENVSDIVYLDFTIKTGDYMEFEQVRV